MRGFLVAVAIVLIVSSLSLAQCVGGTCAVNTGQVVTPPAKPNVTTVKTEVTTTIKDAKGHIISKDVKTDVKTVEEGTNTTTDVVKARQPVRKVLAKTRKVVGGVVALPLRVARVPLKVVGRVFGRR